MSGNGPEPQVNSYDAVLLDAGGVLILPEHDVMRATLAPFGVAPTDAVLTRAHYAGMAARDLAAERHWRAYALTYVRTCGVVERVDEAADVLFAARPEWVSPVLGARAQLAELADLGVALAIVSNAAGTVEWQLGVAGVCQVGPGDGVQVRAVIDSHVVGVRKPDPEIFRLGLAAVRTPPERTLMVGDYVQADVAGAGAAGVPVVHLDPYGDCAVDHQAPHVRTLTDVVDLVRAPRASTTDAS